MKKARLSINNWCKSCGICAAYCPTKALLWQHGEKPVFSAEKCVSCGLCVLRCPDFAIKLDSKTDDIDEKEAEAEHDA